MLKPSVEEMRNFPNTFTVAAVTRQPDCVFTVQPTTVQQQLLLSLQSLLKLLLQLLQQQRDS